MNNMEYYYYYSLWSLRWKSVAFWVFVGFLLFPSLEELMIYGPKKLGRTDSFTFYNYCLVFYEVSGCKRSNRRAYYSHYRSGV